MRTHIGSWAIIGATIKQANDETMMNTMCFRGNRTPSIKIRALGRKHVIWTVHSQIHRTLLFVDVVVVVCDVVCVVIVVVVVLMLFVVYSNSV